MNRKETEQFVAAKMREHGIEVTPDEAGAVMDSAVQNIRQGMKARGYLLPADHDHVTEVLYAIKHDSELLVTVDLADGMKVMLGHTSMAKLMGVEQLMNEAIAGCMDDLAERMGELVAIASRLHQFMDASDIRPDAWYDLDTWLDDFRKFMEDEDGEAEGGPNQGEQ